MAIGYRDYDNLLSVQRVRGFLRNDFNSDPILKWSDIRTVPPDRRDGLILLTMEGAARMAAKASDRIYTGEAEGGSYVDVYGRGWKDGPDGTPVLERGEDGAVVVRHAGWFAEAADKGAFDTYEMDDKIFGAEMNDKAGAPLVYLQRVPFDMDVYSPGAAGTPSVTRATEGDYVGGVRKRGIAALEAPYDAVTVGEAEIGQAMTVVDYAGCRRIPGATVKSPMVLEYRPGDRIDHTPHTIPGLWTANQYLRVPVNPLPDGRARLLSQVDIAYKDEEGVSWPVYRDMMSAGHNIGVNGDRIVDPVPEDNVDRFLPDVSPSGLDAGRVRRADFPAVNLSAIRSMTAVDKLRDMLANNGRTYKGPGEPASAVYDMGDESAVGRLYGKLLENGRVYQGGGAEAMLNPTIGTVTDGLMQRKAQELAAMGRVPEGTTGAQLQARAIDGATSTSLYQGLCVEYGGVKLDSPDDIKMLKAHVDMSGAGLYELPSPTQWTDVERQYNVLLDKFVRNNPGMVPPGVDYDRENHALSVTDEAVLTSERGQKAAKEFGDQLNLFMSKCEFQVSGLGAGGYAAIDPGYSGRLTPGCPGIVPFDGVMACCGQVERSRQMEYDRRPERERPEPQMQGPVTQANMDAKHNRSGAMARLQALLAREDETDPGREAGHDGPQI